MSQKFIKLKNNNRANAKAYGKYFATAVYDNHFVGTDEIADFIQRQASVKKSDIKAVLQELGHDCQRTGTCRQSCRCCLLPVHHASHYDHRVR